MGRVGDDRRRVGLAHFLADSVPLVRPILAVVGILTFISSYNDVIIALTLLKNTQSKKMAVGLYLFSASSSSQHGCCSRRAR